jgi:uncharacterized protein (DUF2225 family)
MVDKINPEYYRNFNIEVIDAITDWHLGYMEGNVVKYVVRHRIKNGKEDILKAIWYLNQILEVEYGGKNNRRFNKDNSSERKEIHQSRSDRSNGSIEKEERMDNKVSV